MCMDKKRTLIKNKTATATNFVPNYELLNNKDNYNLKTGQKHALALVAQGEGWRLAYRKACCFDMSLI